MGKCPIDIEVANETATTNKEHRGSACRKRWWSSKPYHGSVSRKGTDPLGRQKEIEHIYTFTETGEAERIFGTYFRIYTHPKILYNMPLHSPLPVQDLKRLNQSFCYNPPPALTRKPPKASKPSAPPATPPSTPSTRDQYHPASDP